MNLAKSRRNIATSSVSAPRRTARLWHGTPSDGSRLRARQLGQTVVLSSRRLLPDCRLALAVARVGALEPRARLCGHYNFSVQKALRAVLSRGFFFGPTCRKSARATRGSAPNSATSYSAGKTRIATARAVEWGADIAPFPLFAMMQTVYSHFCETGRMRPSPRLCNIGSPTFPLFSWHEKC